MIAIFTIVLDGMNFLPLQLATFNRLHTDWHWYCIEGAAMNTHDTSWCQPQQPRLSQDGSTAFLNSLRNHPRVTVIQQQRWDGKTRMCNAALERIKEPCVLMQIDVDEIWTPDQLDRLALLFENCKSYNCARFFCRYFVGPNIVLTTEGRYGNRNGEWLRAWRFFPGMRFSKHEPPILKGVNDVGEAGGFSQQLVENERCIVKMDTRAMKLIFDHWAYVFPSQVAYKEQFYGYTGALEQWRRLQRNDKWPVKNVRTFLPWVDEGVSADLLWT